jgi:hypothetical protein
VIDSSWRVDHGLLSGETQYLSKCRNTAGIDKGNTMLWKRVSSKPYENACCRWVSIADMVTSSGSSNPNCANVAEVSEVLMFNEA